MTDILRNRPTCLIVLTRGRMSLVDASDFNLLTRHCWHFVPMAGSSENGYACRSERGHKIRMHRQILGLTNGQRVDHIDGNGLNNTRANLRIATQTENMRNRPKFRARTSRYKGVSRHGNAWLVHVQGKHVGRFKSELDAARAYDRAALAAYGEFARLNFPQEAHQ